MRKQKTSRNEAVQLLEEAFQELSNRLWNSTVLTGLTISVACGIDLILITMVMK